MVQLSKYGATLKYIGPILLCNYISGCLGSDFCSLQQHCLTLHISSTVGMIWLLPMTEDAYDIKASVMDHCHSQRGEVLGAGEDGGEGVLSEGSVVDGVPQVDHHLLPHIRNI